jgi:hypothetical protein
LLYNPITLVELVEFLQEDSRRWCCPTFTKLSKLVCHLISSTENMMVFESVEVVLQFVDFLAICHHLVVKARPFLVGLVDHQQ